MTEPVVIWTDGACSGNPGPGGWAAILVWNGSERELSGGERDTTNNRMELMGPLEALRALSRPSTVVVKTDSAYLQRAFTDGWLARWKRNGWQTSGKTPVANRDLWEQLDALVGRHTVTFERVKGHAGVDMNERADRLAVAARERV